MKNKVTIPLTDDQTTLEGKLMMQSDKGTILADVQKAVEGEAETIPIGKKVLVPWSSIKYVVLQSNTKRR